MPGFSGGSGSSGSFGTSPAYNVGPANFNEYLKAQNLPDIGATTSGFRTALRNAPDAFAYKPYMAAVNNQANFVTSAGMNAGNAAARQYSAQANRNGTSGYGAGVARALSMMPGLQQASQLRLQGEEFAASQRAGLANYQRGINQDISQAETSYRSMLAGYNQGMFGIQNQNAQWQAELANRQNEFTRSSGAFSSGATSPVRAPAGGGGSGPSNAYQADVFSGYSGFTSNMNSRFTPSTQFAAWQDRNPGVTPTQRFMENRPASYNPFSLGTTPRPRTVSRPGAQYGPPAQTEQQRTQSYNLDVARRATGWSPI